jgi:hypothetical protein
MDYMSLQFRRYPDAWTCNSDTQMQLGFEEKTDGTSTMHNLDIQMEPILSTLQLQGKQAEECDSGHCVKPSPLKCEMLVYHTTKSFRGLTARIIFMADLAALNWTYLQHASCNTTNTVQKHNHSPLQSGTFSSLHF